MTHCLFMWWLQLTRPVLYNRLQRYRRFIWLNRILSISPIDTPLFSMSPKTAYRGLLYDWRYDDLGA